MSVLRPQDSRHAALPDLWPPVRPNRQPPTRRTPSPSTGPCPHDSLNIPLKYETLECNVRLN
jgi:hypothetical protein